MNDKVQTVEDLEQATTIRNQAEEIRQLKQQLTVLKLTGMSLHLGAKWRSDRLTEEAEEKLWRNFGQALGLPAGMSTRLLALQEKPEPRVRPIGAVAQH